MVHPPKKLGAAVCIVALLLWAVSLSAQESANETIDCPKCGYTNNWSSNFCLSCGFPLAEAKAAIAESVNVPAQPVTPLELAPHGEVEPAVVAVPAVETAKQPEMPKPAEMPKQPETTKQREAVERPEAAKKPATAIYAGPVDPRRLFVIPVAEVLRSLEINLGGGSAFGVRKTEKRPFLGHVRIGLGDVAEVELSTVGIINRLSEGSASIPTAAFKLKFLSERGVRPAASAALLSSLWHSEERGGYKFEKRLSTLYLVASKTLGKVSLHAGMSVNDLRIRTKDIRTDTLISPMQEEAGDKDYFNRNPIGPFAGIRAEVNPKTFLMVEVEQVAAYEFDEEDPYLSKEDIATEWMVIIGVRFFFADWLACDSGVMYRSDYHGIGDAQIQAGLNINVPMQRVVRSWRTKR